VPPDVDQLTQKKSSEAAACALSKLRTDALKPQKYAKSTQAENADTSLDLDGPIIGDDSALVEKTASRTKPIKLSNGDIEYRKDGQHESVSRGEEKVEKLAPGHYKADLPNGNKLEIKKGKDGSAIDLTKKGEIDLHINPIPLQGLNAEVLKGLNAKALKKLKEGLSAHRDGLLYKHSDTTNGLTIIKDSLNKGVLVSDGQNSYRLRDGKVFIVDKEGHEKLYEGDLPKGMQRREDGSFEIAKHIISKNNHLSNSDGLQFGDLKLEASVERDGKKIAEIKSDRGLAEIFRGGLTWRYDFDKDQLRGTDENRRELLHYDGKRDVLRTPDVVFTPEGTYVLGLFIPRESEQERALNAQKADAVATSVIQAAVSEALAAISSISGSHLNSSDLARLQHALGSLSAAKHLLSPGQIPAFTVLNDQWALLEAARSKANASGNQS
jgi:hypothetical protein